MKVIDKSYIFVDESGKSEIYSTKGENLVEKGVASKFLVLCAIRTEDQLRLQQQITDFRAKLLKDSSLRSKFSPAYTLDSFHAQVDYPDVRVKFYEFITTLDIKIDVLVVDKLKCYPSLQQHPAKLYGIMCGQLLKNICHQSLSTEIIFSRRDSKLKIRRELEAEVERVRLEYLDSHPKLHPTLTLQYFHNPHYSHGGLQIADYISYAIFQVFENEKANWYGLVSKKIGKIQDICNKKYFTQSNPL